VQKALDRLSTERTILVITHRLGRNADTIIILKDGRGAEQGTQDELLACKGLCSDMWNTQHQVPQVEQVSAIFSRKNADFSNVIDRARLQGCHKSNESKSDFLEQEHGFSDLIN
jgi:ABC-type multidrug transport system ATPase subunit